MQIISGVIPKALKVVVYGPEGIGKTTFAAQAPEPLFIDTEGGTTRMDVRRLPAPESFAMILEEINYVIQNPYVCKTLVLDTADWAQRKCTDAVCDKFTKSGIEDFGYGKGYSYVYEEFGRLLNLLDQVVDRGIHVIITAHAAMRKFEQPDESGAYDRWEMKLNSTPKCSIAGMVKEWADMVLFANFEVIIVKQKDQKAKATGGKRVMYTTHHPCWDAKNRFSLPEKLPFDFRQIAPLFDMQGMASQPTAPIPQTQPAPKPAPIQPVMPEQTSGAGEARPQAAPPAEDGIPPALRQLMEENHVTEADIRRAVSSRGYYTEDTPIQNYDPAFIEGVLVAAWQQVYQMIKGEDKQ